MSVALGLTPVLAGCALHAGAVPDLVDGPQSGREAVRTLAGTLVGAASPRGRAFLGVPYAAPPMGELRLRPPQPARPWEGARDATRPGPQCLQAISAKALRGEGGGLVLGREDCLYLNIYTPPRNTRPAGAPRPAEPAGAPRPAELAGAPRPAGGWPVMVYLPGGAFVAGAADNYDPSRLASSQGVVVVAVSYRLGALGFLAHPALRAESPGGGSGDFGLLDQQAALRWVRDNIAAFGGDPAAVTLFGESAGAWSVCYQMVSPGAAGLFRRAILESGSCTDRRSLVRAADADAAGPAFAASLGCGDEASAPACLRRLPAGRLARARPTRAGVGGPSSWGPVWGDPVAPLDPAAAFSAGRYAVLPAIVGSNRDEGRLFANIGGAKAYAAELAKDFGERAGEVRARYGEAAYGSPRLAYAALITDSRFACPASSLRNLLARRAPTYGYEFADEDAPFSVPTILTGPMGAYHASELAYVFDTRWVLADPGRFTADQRALSQRMMDAWGRFARGEAPGWPADTLADGAVLTLQPGGDGLAADFAERHQCAFWRTVPRW